MWKGKESIIRKEENYKVVQYKYYFLTKIEMEDYKLKKNEKLIGRIFNEKEPYTYSILIETIRTIETKHIYDADEYAPFIKNLQKTQYSFSYNSEWYNNWIDYVNKMPYDEACALIELLNEFYVAGKENIW
jgi:hypothetical protein